MRNAEEEKEWQAVREKIAKIVFENHASMAQTWQGFTRRYWKDLSQEEEQNYLVTSDAILALPKIRIEAENQNFYPFSGISIDFVRVIPK